MKPLKMNFDVSKLNTEERKKKALLVRDEMDLIINSDLFKEKFLGLTDYHGELSVWKDATITAIYQHIMEGAETLSPEIDNEMDLFVDDYYTIKRVIGMTYESDKFIYTNTKYFDTNSTKAVGSNFLHEWGHKIGFDHDFKATSRRDFSLCYLLNTIYEECWDEMFGEPSDNDKVLVCKRYLFFFQRCNWVKVKDAEPIPV